MPTLTAPAVDVRVFVYREGLLSAAGHDLELSARTATVQLDLEAQRVTVEIAAGSLEVLHAVANGQPAPSLLSTSDRAEIQKNLSRSVLEVSRFPTIRYEGRIDGDRLAGRLELHGSIQPRDLAFTREGNRIQLEAELDQRDFGIRPFRALLGALKVQARVRVQVRVQLP